MQENNHKSLKFDASKGKQICVKQVFQYKKQNSKNSQDKDDFFFF